MEAEFSGNFAHTMDAKGRATIPNAYRGELGEKFTIGLNSELNAVAVYPRAQWEEINRDLSKIPRSDAKAMRYVRKILGNSFSSQEMDAQGRILLPASLREQTGISKNVRFVGVGPYFEIWDEASYQQESECAKESIEELLSYVNERYYRPQL